MIRTWVASIVIFLSLGIDTLAVAIALGIAGLNRKQRLRFGLSFALAEGAMPLVGLGLGSLLARAAGNAASWLAIALLFALGTYVAWESISGEEAAVPTVDGWAKLLIGALSVSIDELAVGFSLGLLTIPVVPAVVYISIQAFVLTWIGSAAGSRLGQTFAGRAQAVSGLALVLVSLYLLAQRLA